MPSPSLGFLRQRIPITRLTRQAASSALFKPSILQHSQVDSACSRSWVPSFTDKEDTWGDEDFTFGAYQPTVGSSEGRQSRRQSVR